MKKIRISLIGIGVFLLSLTSCTNDLNTEPKVELTLEQLLKRDPNAIDGLVAKMYGTLMLSGANGPGSTDTPGDDAGESPFLRGIINLEDFTADDVKNRWGDNGLDQLTTASDWSSSNKFFKYLFNRVYYTVSNSNNIISVLKVVDVPNKEKYNSELRFLRSLAYFYMIDCFGKGVLVTEDDLGTSVPKQQASRVEMFNFVESELIDLESKLPATNAYGHANKSVARMLLAKLYLNAKVYTGTARYNDALNYANKVITTGGYSLAPNYQSLFQADNDTSSAKNEIIFPLIADALLSQSFGNTTYLVNGCLNDATLTLANYGATQGWGGHRATKAWYGLFGSSAAALASSPDDRAKQFWTAGHTYEMNDYKEWTNGFAVTKFRNTRFVGASSNTGFSSTDFPMFRLADTYLMFTECVVRGASYSGVTATNAQALTYLNAVRSRSNATPASLGDLNLNYIIDERGRELNLEGHRRTDLIRFGKFSGGSYLWPWKGNSPTGQAISVEYDLFPIPLSATQANPNLTQNPGY